MKGARSKEDVCTRVKNKYDCARPVVLAVIVDTVAAVARIDAVQAPRWVNLHVDIA